ncbi:MAG: iron-sulfur cluster insertion protein ErpA [Nitrospirae bacterium]|nr:iron-sulfur cluster insertion protein ErpA [Nitrospirota bacterium]MBI3604580.1 iron-sulfur cluster insertion protein ErpA [Nitrospirota bacterium]
MIALTEKAGEKVKELLEAEQKTGYGLRVQVSGGGCSGFQYGMTFEEKANDGDQVIESHGIKLFVDSQSVPLLDGVKVDYVESVQGAGFAIQNPNAKSSCGCGKSFGA